MSDELVAVSGEPAPLAPADPRPAATPLRDDVGVAVAFRGRVVDAAGAPLADADVWLVPSGPTLRAMGLQPESWEMGFGDISNGGALDTVPLAQVPHARTGPGGAFELTCRDVPLKDRTTAESDGAPFPVLVVACSGFTSCTWRARTWQGAACDAGDIALAPELVVTGRAVDEAGQPLRGVAVKREWCFPKPRLAKQIEAALFVPELFTTTTADDGRFALRGLMAGNLGIELRVHDRVRVELNRRDIAEAGTLDLGDVTVPRGTAIDGFVVDESGRPVAGAEVLLTDREIHEGFHFDMGYGYGEGDDTIHDELGQVRRDVRREKVSTDANGAFHEGGLDAANYTVYAVARGFEPGKLRDVGAGSRDARVVLRREAVLVVDVLDDATGAPLSDVHVAATRLAEDPAADGQDGVNTAELEVLADTAAAVARPGENFPPGRFLVRGVGTVGTRLVVQAAGHAETVSIAPGVPLSQRTALTLRLAAESVLAGHVLDAQGPVTGAVVLSFIPGQLHYALPVATTDASGGWEIRGLGAGELHLFARADGHAESDELTVALGSHEQRHDADLLLPPAASLQGRVLHADGTPWANALVRLDVPPFGEFEFAGLRSTFEPWKRANADGRYEFLLLRPGQYQLAVDGAGKQLVELKAGEDRIVDFAQGAPGRLLGRVTSAGEPVADAKVEVTRVRSADGETRGGWIKPVTTDEAGHFETALTGAGDYGVEVSQERGVSLFRQFSAAAGEEAQLDVELPAGAVGGHVVRDTDRAPLADVEIELLRADSAILGFTRSGADGAWRIANVPPGTYRVSSSGYVEEQPPAWGARPGYLPLERGEITLAEGQSLDGVDLLACAGSKLSGAVRLPDGVAVKDGVSVGLVQLRDGAAVAWPSHVWSSSDEDDDPYMYAVAGSSELLTVRTQGGRFLAAQLPAGEYRVTVLSADEESAADVIARGLAITLAEHGEATLDLVASP